jgi:molybdenum cofactor synthesis domain-containing protein
VGEQHLEAIILTVGDEITSGDIENGNGRWLAQQLAGLGVRVRELAAVGDDVEEIALFVEEHRDRCGELIVTGGLGGTPDDVTREGIARAFGVGLAVDPVALERLQAKFPERLHDYVTRFAELPAGATPIPNPLGGAPGFHIGTVYVLPGVPAEMRATFEELRPELAEAGSLPIRTVRLSYQTTESEIVAVLEQAATTHPAVTVGSYPLFDGGARRSPGSATSWPGCQPGSGNRHRSRDAESPAARRGHPHRGPAAGDRRRRLR